MGGLILSLIWMIVLRYSAGLLAWLVVLFVNLLFVACTLLAFTKVSATKHLALTSHPALPPAAVAFYAKHSEENGSWRDMCIDWNAVSV